jgi:hypothetical protein
MTMTDTTMRIPVWTDGDPMEYTVCVAKEHYRHYTDSTVPGQIKSLLSMIRAFPEEVRRVPMYRVMHRSLTDSVDSPVDFPVTYACPDKRLEEIGWQIRDDLYILIMDRTLLEEMFING